MVVRRILAASSAFETGADGERIAGPLVRAAIDLSANARAARVAYLGTAKGDRPDDLARMQRAIERTGAIVTPVMLVSEPLIQDLRDVLLDHDVIYVGGGSVATLLAVWRRRSVDRILREAWELGVVLAGYSAGSLCWHLGGPTDSFGPPLRVVVDGLGLLPHGNAVHLGSDPRRMALLRAAVAEGTLPTSYATEDGVALLYEDEQLAAAFRDRDGVGAYRVERREDAVVETRIEPRLLR